MPKTDEALQVLLDLFHKGKYPFGEPLLRSTYEIEKQYQFDQDRDLPLDHLRRLVEAEVTAMLGHDSEKKE